MQWRHWLHNSQDGNIPPKKQRSEKLGKDNPAEYAAEGAAHIQTTEEGKNTDAIYLYYLWNYNIMMFTANTEFIRNTRTKECETFISFYFVP